jgi:hypothetical protein
MQYTQFSKRLYCHKDNVNNNDRLQILKKTYKNKKQQLGACHTKQ